MSRLLGSLGKQTVYLKNNQNLEMRKHRSIAVFSHDTDYGEIFAVTLLRTYLELGTD